MQRVIAFDYGEKRIGVAISDPLGMTAQPLSYISNDSKVLSSILALIDEYDVKKILFGLPKDQKGGDSKKATEVRAFAEKVTQATNIPIDFADERFSTRAVTQHLIKADVKRKKRKEVVDSLSAQFFLQGYLDKTV